MPHRKRFPSLRLKTGNFPQTPPAVLPVGLTSWYKKGTYFLEFYKNPRFVALQGPGFCLGDGVMPRGPLHLGAVTGGRASVTPEEGPTHLKQIHNIWEAPRFLRAWKAFWSLVREY